jgi:hypothetical protein
MARILSDRVLGFLPNSKNSKKKANVPPAIKIITYNIIAKQ